MKKQRMHLTTVLLLLLTILLFVPADHAEAATKLSKMSGSKLMNTLKTNGFPIESYKIYTTRKSDPNSLIGKPHAYKCKIDFIDRDYYDETFDDDYSGTIEIFKNKSDATKRKKYIASIYKSMPNWAMRMYQYSNVLVRIDYGVPFSRVKYYTNAFSAMSKGKTPKYPISVDYNNLTLYPNQKSQLTLNVSNSKAKWLSSNKTIATVSKTGTITALKPGTTTITAKYNGYTTKCVIKVVQKTNSSAPAFVVRTINWDPVAEHIIFRITNNSNQTAIVQKDMKAYDDYYNYMGSLPTMNGKTISIPVGATKDVSFDNSGAFVYYAQRFIFYIKTGNRMTSCIAEYTYDNNRPYKYTFR